MARPPRIEYEGAYYHVTVRGNARNAIFRDDFDREMFLDVVAAAHRRFAFLIHAFVLMRNHYHLLMETPAANLSATMRHIDGVYTQAFNRRHRTVGHLFQGRFKSFVVDREPYYLELIRYIHLNPLRARAVKDVDRFAYSGHRAIIDEEWAKRMNPWFCRERVLREFGRRRGEALESYRRFVDAGKGMKNPTEAAIGGYALGDRAFADRLWEEFIDGREPREAARTPAMRSCGDVPKVVSAVAKEAGIAPKEVLRSRRGGAGPNMARGMAFYLVNRYSGMTQHEIGEAAGGISRAAVSEAVRRFEKMLADDEDLKRSCERVLNAVSS